MCPQVAGQVALLQEAFAANVAGESEISGMVGHVLVQALLRFECLGATFDVATVRSNVEMRIAVELQFGPGCANLPAYITGAIVWGLRK